MLIRRDIKENMENYRKGKNVEEPIEKEKIPIPNLPSNFLWMHVGTYKHFSVTYIGCYINAF